MSKSFAPIYSGDQQIGFVRQSGASIVFFGNQFATLEILQSVFATLSFRQMRQVHGNTLAKVGVDERPEADALWSDEILIAPIVSTADCLPILVAAPNFACAIHAGWRGILNEITAKSLQALLPSDAQDISVFIGPHILKETFEFDEVPAYEFTKLAQRYNLTADAVVTKKLNVADKVLVDLRLLAEAQIKAACPSAQIVQLPINTYVDAQFCSFRRDRKVGRNLSFAARL